MTAPVRVLVCRVGRLPTVRTLAPDARGELLTAMQACVGGYVECVTIEPGLDLWCNEDGAALGLPLNRQIAVPYGPNAIGVHLVLGDFFLARVKNGELADVTDDDVYHYVMLWDNEDTAAAKVMSEIRAARAGGERAS